MSDTFAKVFGASADSAEDKFEAKRVTAIHDMCTIVQLSISERATLARIFGDDKVVNCYTALPLVEMKEPFLRDLLAIEQRGK